MKLIMKNIPVSLFSVGGYRLEFAKIYFKESKEGNYMYELSLSDDAAVATGGSSSVGNGALLTIKENIHLSPLWYRVDFAAVKKIDMILDLTPVINVGEGAR